MPTLLCVVDAGVFVLEKVNFEATFDSIVRTPGSGLLHCNDQPVSYERTEEVSETILRGGEGRVIKS